MFDSFFLAGFECSTGYNRHGEWFDQVAATQHDVQAHEDYALLRSVGIRAARDAVRWPLVDRGGRYDFDSVQTILDAAAASDVEVILDLFHFGYPVDVVLLSSDFISRFAEYCYATARFVAARSRQPPTFVPINEPSYFAWAAGEAARFAPHWRGCAPLLKVALARAAIVGIEAIWAACPSARIVNVDPLCRVVPPLDRPELLAEAQSFNDNVVFETWDMLCGRVLPELGGSLRHLGTVGINYYWTNQWELNRSEQPLAADDQRCCPLRELVETVARRYPNDILITETGHVGDARAGWLRELADEAESLLRSGVPLRGVCLYPVLGMPEWHERDRWTHMGLWDLVLNGSKLERRPYSPALRVFHELRQRFADPRPFYRRYESPRDASLYLRTADPAASRRGK